MECVCLWISVYPFKVIILVFLRFLCRPRHTPNSSVYLPIAYWEGGWYDRDITFELCSWNLCYIPPVCLLLCLFSSSLVWLSCTLCGTYLRIPNQHSTERQKQVRVTSFIKKSQFFCISVVLAFSIQFPSSTALTGRSKQKAEASNSSTFSMHL